jgi:hypothetical protein
VAAGIKVLRGNIQMIDHRFHYSCRMSKTESQQADNRSTGKLVAEIK